MVHDDRRGGLCGGRPVEVQCSGEAGLEGAEAAGHRKHVRDVADDVTEDEDVDRDCVSGGGERGTERSDVAAQVGDRAGQARVGVEQGMERAVDTGCRVDEPGRLKRPGIRFTRIGIARVRPVEAAPTTIGKPASATVSVPPSLPEASIAPPPTSAATFAALVKKNSAVERSTI